MIAFLFFVVCVQSVQIHKLTAQELWTGEDQISLPDDLHPLEISDEVRTHCVKIINEEIYTTYTSYILGHMGLLYSGAKIYITKYDSLTRGMFQGCRMTES